MAILISGNLDFKLKIILEDKEYYIMIKVSIYHEYI